MQEVAEKPGAPAAVAAETKAAPAANCAATSCFFAPSTIRCMVTSHGILVISAANAKVKSREEICATVSGCAISICAELALQRTSTKIKKRIRLNSAAADKRRTGGTSAAHGQTGPLRPASSNPYADTVQNGNSFAVPTAIQA